MMKTKNTKQSDPNQVVFDEFGRILSSNRGVFWSFAIGLAAFFLVGPWVMFIGVGLLIGFFLLARAFNPLYHILRALIHFENSPPHLVGVSLWRRAYICMSMIAPVYIIYIGVKGLLNFDFCISLICTLSKSFQP